MRTLSAELTAAQQTAPLAIPKVKVEIKNKRGSVVHLRWERLYTGSETHYLHTATMPGDGSLIRARIDPLDNHLYRQRVTSPDENSDYTQWSDTTAAAPRQPALCSYGSTVLLFWVHTDDVTICFIESSDYGASFGDVNNLSVEAASVPRLSASMKPDGTVCLVWFVNDVIYARKRSLGAWGAPVNHTGSPANVRSVAVVYHDDWNVLVTGEDGSDNRYVWQCVFGDGNQAAVNTWTALQEIMKMASDSDYQYESVFIDYLDTFRPLWAETYSPTSATAHNYWTHSIPGKDFIDNLWREPIPFDLDDIFGIAICHTSTHAWLTTPYGVWRAAREVTTWNITDDTVDLKQRFTPGSYRSKLVNVLDNTAGAYDGFDKLGYEMILSLGYTTSVGNEYSATPSFWITGWKYTSPPWFPLHMLYPFGVIGTLQIESEAFWEILQGWKARRPFSWGAGTKTVKELLEFVLSRVGFELDVWSSSTAIDNLQPEFAIPEGYNGRWAVKKLLSWVEDVLVQRDNKIYLKHPQADDAVDYTYDSMYGTAHLVYRGQYGEHQWDPNRAQVWGSNLMVERFEWDQINAVADKLSRVEKPTYTTVTRAGERADRELRHGEIWTGAGGWCQVPTNCGQEAFDVIQVSDYTAGVANIKRRVIGIYTTYRKRYGSFMQVLKLGMP